MTGKQAWPVIGAIVVGVDLLALQRGRPQDTLSATVDRARALNPLTDTVVTYGILITAAHLLRVLPAKTDPFRLVGLGRRGVRR